MDTVKNSADAHWKSVFDRYLTFVAPDGPRRMSGVRAGYDLFNPDIKKLSKLSFEDFETVTELGAELDKVALDGPNAASVPGNRSRSIL